MDCHKEVDARDVFIDEILANLTMVEDSLKHERMISDRLRLDIKELRNGIVRHETAAEVIEDLEKQVESLKMEKTERSGELDRALREKEELKAKIEIYVQENNKKDLKIKVLDEDIQFWRGKVAEFESLSIRASISDSNTLRQSELEARATQVQKILDIELKQTALATKSEDTLNDLHIKIVQLTNELKYYKHKANSLEATLNNQEEKLAQLPGKPDPVLLKKIQAAEKKVKHQSEQLSIALRTWEITNATLAQKTIELDALKADFELLEHTAVTEKKLYDAKAAELGQMASDRELLLTEISDLKSTLKERDQEKLAQLPDHTLLEKIQAAEKKVKHQSEQLSIALRTWEITNATLAQKTIELDALKADFELLEHTAVTEKKLYDAKAAELGQMASDRELLLTEISDLKSTLKERVNELSILKYKIDPIMDRLDEDDSYIYKMVSLEDQVKIDTDNRAKVHDDIVTGLKSEIENLNSMVIELNTSIHTLNEELTDLQATKVNQELQLHAAKEIEKDKYRLENQVEALQTMTLDLNNTISTMTIVLKSTKDQLKSIKSKLKNEKLRSNRIKEQLSSQNILSATSKISTSTAPETDHMATISDDAITHTDTIAIDDQQSRDAECKAIEAAYGEMLAVVDRYAIKLADVQDELDLVKTQAYGQSKLLSDVQGEYEEFKKTVKDSVAQIEALKSEMAEQDRYIQSLKAERDQAKVISTESEKEVFMAKDDLGHEKGIVSDSETRIQSLNKRKSELEASELNLADMVKQVEIANQAIQECEATFNIVSSDKDQISVELNKCRVNLSDIEQKLNELENDRDSLLISNQQLQQANAYTSADLESTRKQLENHKNDKSHSISEEADHQQSEKSQPDNGSEGYMHQYFPRFSAIVDSLTSILNYDKYDGNDVKQGDDSKNDGINNDEQHNEVLQDLDQAYDKIKIYESTVEELSIKIQDFKVSHPNKFNNTQDVDKSDNVHIISDIETILLELDNIYQRTTISDSNVDDISDIQSRIIDPYEKNGSNDDIQEINESTTKNVDDIEEMIENGDIGEFEESVDDATIRDASQDTEEYDIDANHDIYANDDAGKDNIVEKEHSDIDVNADSNEDTVSNDGTENVHATVSIDNRDIDNQALDDPVRELIDRDAQISDLQADNSLLAHRLSMTTDALSDIRMNYTRLMKILNSGDTNDQSIDDEDLKLLSHEIKHSTAIIKDKQAEIEELHILLASATGQPSAPKIDDIEKSIHEVSDDKNEQIRVLKDSIAKLQREVESITIESDEKQSKIDDLLRLQFESTIQSKVIDSLRKRLDIEVDELNRTKFELEAIRKSDEMERFIISALKKRIINLDVDNAQITRDDIKLKDEVNYLRKERMELFDSEGKVKLDDQVKLEVEVNSENQVDSENQIKSEDTVESEVIVETLDQIKLEDEVNSENQANSEDQVNFKHQVKNEHNVESEVRVETLDQIKLEDEVNSEDQVKSEDQANSEDQVNFEDQVNLKDQVKIEDKVESEVIVETKDQIQTEDLVESKDQIQTPDQVNSKYQVIIQDPDCLHISYTRLQSLLTSISTINEVNDTMAPEDYFDIDVSILNMTDKSQAGDVLMRSAIKSIEQSKKSQKQTSEGLSKSNRELYVAKSKLRKLRSTNDLKLVACQDKSARLEADVDLLVKERDGIALQIASTRKDCSDAVNFWRSRYQTKSMEYRDYESVNASEWSTCGKK